MSSSIDVSAPSPGSVASGDEARFRLHTRQGRPYSIVLRQPERADRFYCVALHKSGSVLFDNLVKDLCEHARRSCMDPEVQLFNQGLVLPDCGDDLLALCGTAGVVYSGFRELWRLPELAVFRTSLKLMLVRDPRDIAISYYHSQSKSHAIPTTGPLRDEVMLGRQFAQSHEPSTFILAGGADAIFRNVNAYAALYRDAEAGPLKLYRYEDIIYAKLAWARELAVVLGIDIAPDRLQALVARHDIFPEREDPQAHIRRVHPGGYRSSLTPEAIAYVEARCAAGMAVFGYAQAG